MKFIKAKLKTIHNGNETACILTYTYHNYTKTFSKFFSGKDNNIGKIICFALKQLKEPCCIEMTVSDKFDYNALKLIQGFGQFPPKTYTSTIVATKKLLATHKVKFILDYTSIIKIPAITKATKFRPSAQISPNFTPFKKESFWNLGKHYATKRREDANPYRSAQNELEKWKKRQQTPSFSDD
ncbi:MAG: hypothetical protein J6J24_05250 [Clostridia bacterium]|nr:hypothetical protein [Clostridia bacterium]